MEGSRKYRERHGGPCAFEEVLREETGDGKRRLFESDGFVAYTPFASALAYEVRVLPLRHAASFASVTDDEAMALAGQLTRLLRALLSVLPGASYNFVVRSPGGSAEDLVGYHWHLDLYPRLVRPDGFDLGSGYSVNTVPPEVAAEALRDALAAKR